MNQKPKILVFDRKEIELAWAAGFFDGEGSSKKHYYHYKTKTGKKRIPTTNVCMSVAQAELTVLQRFQQAINGLGNINGPYNYNSNNKPYWIWSASCKSARDVFRLLTPYLSSIKIQQFKKTEVDINE